MMRFLLLLAVLTMACAHAPLKSEPVFSGTAIAEARPLPKDPADYDLSQFKGGEKDVTPLAKADPAPADGMLSSEKRFARDSAYRSAYAELAVDLKARQSEWTAQRALYERIIADQNASIDKLKPDWWDRNGPYILLGLGFGLGALTTVEIAYAVRK